MRPKDPQLFCSEQFQTYVLSSYEIPANEPLHDITNMVQNLITELPSHIQDKSAQAEFQKFSESTTGDKNQLKGSGALTKSKLGVIEEIDTQNGQDLTWAQRK